MDARLKHGAQNEDSKPTAGFLIKYESLTKKETSMTKKTFQFVTAIVGGLQTAAVGAVTYFLPENATAINGAIVIIGTAIIEACAQFVKPEQEK